MQALSLTVLLLVPIYFAFQGMAQNEGTIPSVDLPYSVYRTNVGTFEVEATKESVRKDWITEGRVVYVDPVNGSNENSGESWGEAKATIDGALLVGEVVYLSEGIHIPWSYYRFANKDFSIIGTGQCWVGYLNKPDWHKHRIHEHLLNGIAIGNPKLVLREDKIDEHGAPLRLVEVDSVEDCAITPESWTITGPSRLTLNASNLEKVVVSGMELGVPAIGVTTSSTDRYYENVTFLGIRLLHTGNDPSTKVCFNSCEMWFGRPDRGHDLVDFNGIGKVMLYSCRAGYAQRDVFNYHAANEVIPLVYEIECSGCLAGLSNDGVGSHQVTTSHDGVKIVRVNGSYLSGNQALADTGENTISWNYGCHFGGGTVANVASYDQAVVNLDWCSFESSEGIVDTDAAGGIITMSRYQNEEIPELARLHPVEDHDANGFCRLVEYALPSREKLGEPREVDAPNLRKVGEQWEYSFHRRRNAPQLGLVYGAEVASDLSDWLKLTESATEVIDSNWEKLTFLMPPTVPSNYFRLNFEVEDDPRQPN